MNSSSSSQLLQKLQNLYSGNKKISEHSVSPLQPRPFACREINQLLEKSSPIPYLQVKKHDVEQWTERLMKPTEKASCSSFTQNENKYSQISTISQQTFPVLMQIDKKVKLLKYAKENDHNTCAAIIAKMKLFCLDNAQTCYDFYRSTDLILLKYMIFLLIQEINQRPGIEKQEISNDQTSQFQQMVKDIVSIVYEIIEEIKQKSFANSHIDKLNKQLTQIQNKFKHDPNSTQKSINKSHHQRFSSCNFENCKTPISNNKSNKESNISSDKFKSGKQQQNNVSGSQKIIKFQIDELEQKKQLINKLNEQISTLQNINKQQQVQIQDSNCQIIQIKQELELKQQEIEKLQQSLEIFKSKDQIYKEDKDKYNILFNEYENENIQLKSNLQQIENTLQMCQTQFENYKQETFSYYQTQYNQIQQIKDKEINHLKNELKENQININHLLGDALYFGKQYKSLVDRIVYFKSESIANDLTQLQKELFYSENTLNSKLNAIANFSENLQFNFGQESLLSQNQSSNQIGNLNGIQKSTIQQYNVNKKNCSQDYLIAQKNQFELMEMLLIQSQVLEKFLI